MNFAAGVGCAVACLAIGCGSGGSGGIAPEEAQTFPSDTALGEACAAAPDGSVSLDAPGVDLSAIVEARFSTSSTGGYLSMAPTLDPAQGCGCCQVQRPVLSFRMHPEDMTLGEHAVGPGAEEMQVSLWLDGTDAEKATAGTITFNGFDPDAAALCGTLRADFATYGSVQAAFSAYDICP